MIVIPKENPIIGNLNSYYVQIERLIEHFQGEVGCGCLYFKSLSSEGILFFDKDEILNEINSGEKGCGNISFFQFRKCILIKITITIINRNNNCPGRP